jgi:hypothetical protein
MWRFIPAFGELLARVGYLRLQKGAEAAAEFQKIVDHKGANWGATPVAVLLHRLWVSGEIYVPLRPSGRATLPAVA